MRGASIGAAIPSRRPCRGLPAGHGGKDRAQSRGGELTRVRPMAISDKQRGVLGGMAAAVVIGAMVMVGAVLLGPALLVPTPDFAGRMIQILPWELLVVVWLIAAVGALARHRFFTPEDIDGSGLTAGTETAKVMQAILQNTLEQTVIALAVHGIATAVLPMAWLPVVPAAAVLFAVGRLLFWAGYRRGAAARALGFALTFYSSVAVFLLSVIALVWPG